MSLAELRAELREHRKHVAPPVSRMKKGDVMMELERVRPVVEEPVVAKVAKKAVAVKETKTVAKKEPVEEAKSIKHSRK